MRLADFSAEVGGDDLAEDDDPEDRQQDRQDALPAEEVDRRVEFAPDPAGANEADDRRRPDVDVPPVGGDAHERRFDLRGDPVDRRLQ